MTDPNDAAREAARYRALIDATADLVWRSDAHGRALDAGRWPAITGQTAADVLGYGWWTVVHPDDLIGLTAAWRAGLRERRSYTSVFRLRVAGGGYRRFYARGVPIFGADGRVAEWVGVAQDVEDRMEAEDAVRASEARYRSLVEATAQMVWRTAPDGTPLGDFADVWSAFTGVPVCPESPGELWLAPVHPDDHATIDARWREALASGTPYDFVYRVRAADGAWRRMHVRALPVHGADGAITEWVGTHTDVTERDASRAALERERGLLAEAQRIGRLGSWSWNLTTGEAWVSDEVHRIFGVAPDEVALYGANVIEAFDALCTPEARAAVQADRRAVIEGRLPMSIGQWQLRRPDGRELEVVTRSEWRYDDAGHPVHASGTVQDVTEQAAADAALRASEERFRLVARATHEALYEWDVARRTVWASDQLLEMFRVPPGTVADHEWWRAGIHPEDRPGVLASLDRALAGSDDVCTVEYRFRRGDGTWATVMDRALVLRDAEGRALRVTGALLDVSEQRALETQLRQAQKLEAVGQLAGGVAHDFNNLLSVILASAELSRGGAAPDSVLAADLDEIVRAAQRGARLTRQLLAFSRRQVLRPRLVDLSEIVRGAEPLLRRLLSETIALDLVVPDTPCPDCAVHVDPGQIEQVLMNLVVNARDALAAAPSGGGMVQIAVDTLRVDAGPGGAGPASGAASDSAVPSGAVAPGAYVRVRVRDDGAGMDAATRARAFEPFFTTKGPGQGTGLGLSTAYGIAAQSGGTMLVDSAPGEGATFSVLLPSAAEAGTSVASERSAAAPSPAANAGTVLLVEDEAAVRRMTRRLLERHGYRVLEARHGADALLVWDEQGGAVDVLLTDLRMPEMGGHELIARLRARRPELPAVLMSGYVREPTAGAAAEVGPVVRAIDKPFTPEELLGAVGGVMRVG